MAKKILMIHTGGTLSMKQNEYGALLSQNLSNIINDIIPDLKDLADITHIQLFAIDSSSIEISHILLIAQTLDSYRYHYDGFVITHGTDTMAYTASALSFMFRNFGKPIVLTGAQRPLQTPRTDAKMNIIDAVIVASIKGLNEIVLVFDSTVFRGSRVKKQKIDQYDAFDSPNFPPLAKLGVDINFYKETNFGKGRYKFYPYLEPNITVIKIFPGINFNNIKFITPPKAIIIEAFGAGNLMIDKNLISYINRNKKIPIMISSQAEEGVINLNLYEAGHILKLSGAIGTGDMTFESIIFKTMHLLSFKKGKKWFIKRFQKDLVGELSYNFNPITPNYNNI